MKKAAKVDIMKIFEMLLVMCCCAAITSSAAAVITGDAGGNFHVEGEASDFVNWASTNHAVSVLPGQTMMQTILDTAKGYHYTTSPSTQSQADLDILFRFDQPLLTCRLDYGSVVDESQSLDAFVQIGVTADGNNTLIYLHTHKHSGGDFNYTQAGGVPNGVDGDTERHRAYTIIDDLVAGETEFTLNIAVVRGTFGGANTGLNLGGSFLPDREAASPPLWPESDFIMSGSMVREPNYCGDDYTQYLAGDISGLAGAPDCYVNLHDVALMAKQWLECSDPGNADCTSLGTVLLQPAYRGSFFASVPEWEAVVQAKVSGLEATGGEAKVRAKVEGTGETGEELVVTEDGVYELRCDMAGKSPGEYRIAVELADQEGMTLAGTEHELRILPPSDFEATFDANRVCFLNGEPFFPIGLFHVCRATIDEIEAQNLVLGLPTRTVSEHLQDIKDHGFNCVVHSWGFPDEEFRGLLADAGLYWSPEVGWIGSQDLSVLVEEHKQDPCLLWWYGIDEAVGADLDKAIQDRAMFEEIDPYHPVAAAVNKPDSFGNYMQAFDILMPDAYGTSLVAPWTDGCIQAGQGRVPVWVIPQGFGVEPSDVPTPEELRCEAFLALTHGATGLIWFTYAHPFEGFQGAQGYRDGWWYLPETPLWAEFAQLNQEIADLTPVLVSPPIEASVTASDEAIHVLLKEYGGKYYLFAVNDSPASVACQFTELVPNGNVEVLFGGSTITPNSEGWADQFEGYATRVYRF